MAAMMSELQSSDRGLPEFLVELMPIQWFVLWRRLPESPSREALGTLLFTDDGVPLPINRSECVEKLVQCVLDHDDLADLVRRKREIECGISPSA